MKAILIIGKPECCGECPLCIHNKGIFICNRTTKEVDKNKMNEDCPLKPIPKYYPSTSNPQRIEYLKQLGMTEKEQHYYELGHDDCIDEILGDTE